MDTTNHKFHTSVDIGYLRHSTNSNLPSHIQYFHQCLQSSYLPLFTECHKVSCKKRIGTGYMTEYQSKKGGGSVKIFPAIAVEMRCACSHTHTCETACPEKCPQRPLLRQGVLLHRCHCPPCCRSCTSNGIESGDRCWIWQHEIGGRDDFDRFSSIKYLHDKNSHPMFEGDLI